MNSPIGNTENELVQACLANNRLAQKNLYDKYKKAMYSLCYRITGDFEAANDVLQDAFVKVFRGLPSFRAESTLGAWIKTIVVRTAYSYLRKEKCSWKIWTICLILPKLIGGITLILNILKRQSFRCQKGIGWFLCWLKLKDSHIRM